jgi:hypothetical protein
MSIYRSYFSRNNTLISNLFTNTARNPVVELNFGSSDLVTPNFGFTRFIFDLDLDGLREMMMEKYISTGCTSAITHTLMMTNTSSFEDDLLNTNMNNGRKRATSFDLILFRIPKFSGDTGTPQLWDEGVGYDYNNFGTTSNGVSGSLSVLEQYNDKNFSLRPSNWYQTTTVSNWSQPGIYDNKNTLTGLTGLNYSSITIVDEQHFELGNEDIQFDLTSEINGILDGSITGVTGWGIAYKPDIENLSGLTDSYSVGFFGKYTQTFYQPYLLTDYNDLIQDDRNLFLKNQTNKLYLYVYQNGDFVNLDNLPGVNIEDQNGDVVPGGSGLTTCQVTRGVYEVTVPNIFTTQPVPCLFYDVWTGLTVNGQSLPNVTNQFVLQNYSAGIQIGSLSKEPSKYGFSFYGILQNEKILNTEIRKVGVVVKKEWTSQHQLENVDVYYRIYVTEGTTEVQVQDWTSVNRTPNEYYFMFDMRDKIPNEYYVDIRVNTSGEKDIYKDTLRFQIVNKK